jgi:hypothetical protein
MNSNPMDITGTPRIPGAGPHLEPTNTFLLAESVGLKLLSLYTRLRSREEAHVMVKNLDSQPDDWATY